MARCRLVGAGGDNLLWWFVATMVALETSGAFGSEPASPLDEAHTAIIAYLALSGLAGVVDWVRGTLGSVPSGPRTAARPATVPRGVN